MKSSKVKTVDQDQKGIYLEKNPIIPIGKKSKLDKLNSDQILEKLNSISIQGKRRGSLYVGLDQFMGKGKDEYRDRMRKTLRKFHSIIQADNHLRASQGYTEADIEKAKEDFLEFYFNFYSNPNFKIQDLGNYKDKERESLIAFLSDMEGYYLSR